MACIYIRLPISRCQYYRNRDINNPLEPHQPVKFSEYSEEYFVLQKSIYNKVLNEKADSRFFTQQEWINMLKGKDPAGKKMLYKRQRDQWLRYNEIIALMGDKQNNKSLLFDYLCIKLPNEVFCVDNIRNVTPTWCIDKYGYERLYSLINNDFKRSVIEWALSTFDYCTSNGKIIIRGQQAMLERYLIRYNIYPTSEEKNSLRRVIDRWFKQEHCNFTSYCSFDMKYNDKKEKILQIEGVEWT